MPVLARFDENIIVIEMMGEYTIEELRSVIFKTFSDTLRPQNGVLLIDLSQAQSIYQRSSEMVNTMAHFIASYAQYFNNRVALIAPDELKYGLMRMSSAPAESLGIQVEIFKEYLPAREWLLTA
jgi:hypothetical protein